MTEKYDKHENMIRKNGGNKTFTIKSVSGQVMYTGLAKSKARFIEQLVSEGKDLSYANLSGLKLRNCNLRDAQMSHAIFHGTDLRGTDFTDAQLRYADFSPLSYRRKKVHTHSGEQALSMLRAHDLKKNMDSIRYRFLYGNDIPKEKLEELATNSVEDDLEISPVLMMGANFERANLNGAVLKSVNASGAGFISSFLNGAKVIDSNFSHISGHRSSWMYADVNNSNFSSSNMMNADFYGGRLVNNDFLGTNFDHAVLQSSHGSSVRPIIESHLHDRTENAIFVGSKTDSDTVIPDSMMALKRDNNFNKLFGRIRWVGSTFVGAFLADKGLEFVHENCSEFMHRANAHPTISMTIMIGAFSGVALLIKEMASDFTKDHMRELANCVAYKGRELMMSAKKTIRNKLDIVALMGNKKAMEPLRLALDGVSELSKKKGFFSTIKDFMLRDVGRVILCDRQHLALTMRYLSMRRRDDYPINNDITLVRCNAKNTDEHDASAPCLLRFSKDGKMTAVWPHDEYHHILVRYDKRGHITECVNEYGEEVPHNCFGYGDGVMTRLQNVNMFERFLLNQEKDLVSFRYDTRTHNIKRGRKGSILVFSNHDGLLDNMSGQPSLLTMKENGAKGKSVHFRHGGLDTKFHPKGSPPPILDEPSFKL